MNNNNDQSFSPVRVQPSRISSLVSSIQGYRNSEYNQLDINPKPILLYRVRELDSNIRTIVRNWYDPYGHNSQSIRAFTPSSSIIIPNNEIVTSNSMLNGINLYLDNKQLNLNETKTEINISSNEFNIDSNQECIICVVDHNKDKFCFLNCCTNEICNKCLEKIIKNNMIPLCPYCRKPIEKKNITFKNNKIKKDISDLL
jgi:hypothetical protein